ncbi:hypothetical protein GRI97_17905 [Altererythrobacter xixiisoli]|uniref:Uncharacterized protein n=1 Tax=Croceibacterium xixiisoli TaxID=1476466 RepID=A0A6I4TXX0_9SPHN|nr:hypothetical protein [Croceibacterium xixiisoli]MXP00867.1 hypothetical protein [Croceibacterium xixiisoli]
MDNSYLDLVEAKALRDAARKLVESDVELIRIGVSERSVTERAFGRVYDGVADAAEGARDICGSPVKIALIAGGIGALWFARKPIIGAIEGLFSSDREQGEPAEHSEDTPNQAMERPGNDRD